jgi:septum formation protein
VLKPRDHGVTRAFDFAGPPAIARADQEQPTVQLDTRRSGDGWPYGDAPREGRPFFGRWLATDDFRQHPGCEALKGNHDPPDSIIRGHDHMDRSIVLASASPRRAELLTSAGFTFRVQPAEVDETPRAGELPADYVARVARDKAHTVAARSESSTLVLGADTTVVVSGQILGKPADRADAARMLQLLSGAVHEVLTGVVLVSHGREEREVVTSRVRLLPLTTAEIDWYLNSGEPMGKAGAYGIQGRAARFIDWLEGSWSNVVGLPVATVYQMLKRAGA